jgi:hypothetical protein
MMWTYGRPIFDERDARKQYRVAKMDGFSRGEMTEAIV